VRALVNRPPSLGLRGSLGPLFTISSHIRTPEKPYHLPLRTSPSFPGTRSIIDTYDVTNRIGIWNVCNDQLPHHLPSLILYAMSSLRRDRLVHRHPIYSRLLHLRFPWVRSHKLATSVQPLTASPTSGQPTNRGTLPSSSYPSLSEPPSIDLSHRFVAPRRSQRANSASPASCTSG
jgi:hypothetical protein